jgi:hypothetical protein
MKLTGAAILISRGMTFLQAAPPLLSLCVRRLRRRLMAHRLDPPDGESYLPPPEVVRRLQGAFAVVDADPEAGAAHVAAMIRQFERTRVPAELIAEHRQAQPFAIRVVVAEAPECGDAYLTFVALPGDGLFVGYHSAQHEAAAAPLLERCRRALGYQATLV